MSTLGPDSINLPQKAIVAINKSLNLYILYVPLSLGQLLGLIIPIIGQILTPSLFSWVTMSIKTGLELLEGQNSEKNINGIFNFTIFAIFHLYLMYEKSGI